MVGDHHGPPARRTIIGAETDMRESANTGRRWAAWLVLAAVLAFVIGLVLLQEGPQTVPVRAAEHPEAAAGTPCSSCKAPGHQYDHKAPYDGEKCERCHVLRSWGRVAYEHAQPDFNEGFHAVVGCAFCHTEGKPDPSPDCGSCHKAEHPPTTPCSDCHQAAAWRVPRPLPERHVSLSEGHSVLQCFDCHKGRSAFTKPKKCVQCHGSKHGGLRDCAECHDPARGDWSPKPSFKHDRFFALRGAHRKLDCRRCHPNLNFVATDSDCRSCHGTKHGGVTNCGLCHDPAVGSWKPKPGFDHSPFFVLSGRHRRLACRDCHRNLNFAAARPDCRSCHGSKHGGLTDCAQCHTTANFVPSTFRHSTAFVLTGAHTRLACTSCHPGRRFAFAIGEPGACGNCHEAMHGGLTACGSCHTTAGFRASTFDHDTEYKLTGKHRSRACTKCHPDREFARVIGDKRWCVSCHGVQHGGLRRCGACHTTSGFVPSTFKHASRFALTGRHAKVDCVKCHSNARYADVIGSPSRCTNCHGIKHGNQVACEDCHTTAGFSPAKSVSHPVEPTLGGEHAARPCTLCHTNLVFTDPTRECSSCHQAPHVAPTDCLRCHKPTVWSEVDFFHAEVGYHTQFPIEEACLMCHTTGDYSKYVCDQCHWPFN